MRIGIDARSILNPDTGDAIGIGHYTYQLIRHIINMDGENEYVLFFDSRVREKDVKKFSQPNVKIVFYPFSDYRKYLPGVYNELLGAAILQKEKLDILHTTSPSSRIPARYKGKTVVTFNNMAMFSVPEYFPSVKRTKEKTAAELMAKKANKVIAVSQSIKDELIKYLNVPEEKIELVYSGLDERFYQEAEIDARTVLDRFGITKKYILFLGTLEPSKNIAGLLEAFAKFKAKRNENDNECDYQLVLAGKKGWLSEELPSLIKDLGLEKDVIMPGYLVGEELVPLFKNAVFFIMPSFYEGFGTTVLEAFATQTPSIISRIASLPEIAGEGALYIDPHKTEAITEAMLQFAGNDQLRNSFRDKQIEQAKKFSWEKTAKETLEIYKNLV